MLNCISANSKRILFSGHLLYAIYAQIVNIIMVLIENAKNVHHSTYEKNLKCNIVQSDGQLVRSQNDAESSKVEEEAKHEKYRIESCSSAECIRANINAKSLAKAGFYYIAARKVTQCFSCKSCVKDWTRYDDPLSKKWHRTDCQHINNIGIETLSNYYSSVEDCNPNFPSDSRDNADLCLAFGTQSSISTIRLETQRKSTPNLAPSSSTIQRHDYEHRTEPKSIEANPMFSSNYPSSSETSYQNRDYEMRPKTPQTNRTRDSYSTSLPTSPCIEPPEYSALCPSMPSASDPEPASGVIAENPRTKNTGLGIQGASFEAAIRSNADNSSFSQPAQSTTDASIEDPSVLATSQTSSGVQVEVLPESELDVNDGYLTDLELATCQSLHPCQNPHTPNMIYLHRRIASYETAFLENPNLNANQLAAAGFYYAGFFDKVRCWYCGVEADNWTADKNAWIEHARLFPSCDYLLRNRGNEFVEATLFQESSSRHASIREPEYQELERSFSLESLSERIQSGPEELPISPMESLVLTEAEKSDLLNESMESDFVRTALEMKFTPVHIRRVLKRQISDHSCNFQSVQALLEALIITPPASTERSSEPTSSNTGQPRRNQSNDDSKLLSMSQASRTESSSQTISRPRSRSSSLPPEAGQELLERIRNEERCKVCLDKQSCVLFRPCSHICTCLDCARQLSSCPICRRGIESSIIITRP